MADDLVMRAAGVLDGVTPGPWRVFTPDDYEGPEYHPGLGVESEKGNAVVWYATGPEEGLERDQDARFIAWSREGVPAMADLIRELEAEVARLTQERDDYCVKWGDVSRGYAALTARSETAEAKLAKALEALAWCSGSDDFQEGGKAREGWVKLCAPLISENTKEISK